MTVSDECKGALEFIFCAALAIAALVFGLGWGCYYLGTEPRFSCQDKRLSAKVKEYETFTCDHSLQKLTREGDDWICRCAP